jgi:hypothetical protein
LRGGDRRYFCFWFHIVCFHFYMVLQHRLHVFHSHSKRNEWGSRCFTCNDGRVIHKLIVPLHWHETDSIFSLSSRQNDQTFSLKLYSFKFSQKSCNTFALWNVIWCIFTFTYNKLIMTAWLSKTSPLNMCNRSYSIVVYQH